MDHVRALLLTHRGRVTIFVTYVVFATSSVVVYAFWRGPLYALGQAAILGFGGFWVVWCLRRSARRAAAPEGAASQ